MKILSFFLGRHTFFYQNVLVWIPVVLLVGTLSVSSVYAVGGGQAAFEISPVFSDPHNPVTTSYFVMNAQPATHPQNSLLVTNIGTKRGTIMLYPVDAFTAATGGTMFRRRTDARTDVGAWILLSRHQLTLAPGQSQAVPFHLNIPAHARPGQHVGGITVDSTTVQTFTSKNIPITLHQFRIIAVQVNVPGTPIERLAVTGIRPNTTGRYQQILLNLSNTGNMMVKSTGSLQLFDSKGDRLQNLPLHLDTFLPQTSISDPIFIQQHALPIGHYKAVLILTYGHNQQLYHTTTFTILAVKKTLSNAVSTLVTLGDSQSFLSLLAPWQLVVGGAISLLVIGTLASWLYKLVLFIVRLRARVKTKRIVAQPEPIVEPFAETIHTHVTKRYSKG